MRSNIQRLYSKMQDKLWVFSHNVKNRGVISPASRIVNSCRIEIGYGTSVGSHATIHADGDFVQIGENCVIHPYAYLRLHGGWITMGNRVLVNPFAVLYGHGGLRIGNDILIASHVTVVAANHNFGSGLLPIVEQGETRLGIEIGDDVWIGTGAKILDGVKIAKGSVIGAGAVVTKPTQPYGVYYGVPARFVRFRRIEEEGSDDAPRFPDESDAEVEASGTLA